MAEGAAAMIRDYLAQSRDAMAAALAEPGLVDTVAAMVDGIAAALRAGGKVLIAGNGGSAADAQHIAGEFLSRFHYDRAPAAAVALSADAAVLTAIGNDYGFEEIFRRQVLGLGRAGDVLLALSTSGRSRNVLRALEAARAAGLITIGFTGRAGGDMPPLCDLCLRAPADATPLIQQIHLAVGHALCALVEQRLFPRDGRS
jgi:D-sedoheptulose 7-phosphate isomerase